MGIQKRDEKEIGKRMLNIGKYKARGKEEDPREVHFGWNEGRYDGNRFNREGCFEPEKMVKEDPPW